MNVDEYSKNIDPQLREIVEKLRQTIKATSRQLKEEIKWNAPTYSINNNICSIMAHRKHVNLQIFQGAKINDVNQLIGTGKGMRHIKFDTLADVKVSLIRKILIQAINLDK